MPNTFRVSTFNHENLFSRRNVMDFDDAKSPGEVVKLDQLPHEPKYLRPTGVGWTLRAVIAGVAMLACEASTSPGGAGTTDASALHDATQLRDALECDQRLARATGVTLASTLPSSTAAGIADDFDSHYWSEPVGTPTHRLLVFLPGTGFPPYVYTILLKLSAASGYHVVGLAYPNPAAVVSLCLAAPGCPELVQGEIISGEDLSPLVSVDRANSIENRLVQFLAHTGWTEYLSGSTPVWQNIAVAGHSQGAGHAVMMGQRHAVHRVVALAGPVEADPWTAGPSQTASDRYWGFAHVDDGLAANVQDHWENLRIPGVPTDIEAEDPPFGGSQRLLTSAPAFSSHAYVVMGGSTADAGDSERLERAWCALFRP